MIWALLVGIVVGSVLTLIFDEIYDLRKIHERLDTAQRLLDESKEMRENADKIFESYDKVYEASLRVIKAYDSKMENQMDRLKTLVDLAELQKKYNVQN